MAKTLREFLEARALRDYKSGEGILHAARQLSSLRRDLLLRKQYADWVKIFDPKIVQKMPNFDFSMDQFALGEVQLYLLAAAGEAVKRAEAQNPTIREQAPTFPWRSHRDIRDIYSHLTKHVLRSNQIEHEKDKLRVKIAEITAYTAELDREIEEVDHGRRSSDDCNKLNELKRIIHIPHIKFASDMLDLAKALSSLAAASDTRNIRIINNPNQLEVSRALNLADGTAPLIIHGLFSLNLVCALNNQLATPSLMFRSLHPELYLEANKKVLANAKNKAAHFDELISSMNVHEPSPDGRRVVQYHVAFFEDKELDAIEYFAGRVPNILGARYYLHIGKKQEDAVSELCEKYEISILGSSIGDGKKVDLMDKETRWVSTGSYTESFQDAYLMAAGRVASKFSCEDAKETFDFIHRNHMYIKKPDTMKQKAGEISLTMRHRIELFLTEMQKAISPNGSKAASVA